MLDVSPDILVLRVILSGSEIYRAVLECMYASYSKILSQSTLGDFILVIFLSDPIFSSRIPPSAAIWHRDSGSVCLKWHPFSATSWLKSPKVWFSKPSTIILGGTPYCWNKRESASFASPFLAMGNAREHPNFVTNILAYLFPRLDLVPARKVSPKTSCWSLLYRNFQSFVWKQRLKEWWSTVRIPLWFFQSNARRAASNTVPQFALISVGYVICIQVEACPTTLETIMRAFKTFSKFLSLHSWRDFQGFVCIPAKNRSLNSSGLSLNNLTAALN